MSLDKRHLWSSEEIEAFERWEMPDLTGISLRSLGHEKISADIIDQEKGAAEEEVEEVHLPTLEEVEAIRREAYEEAYAEGVEQGRLDGFEQGREDGFLKGKAEGYEEGVDKGYQEGLQQGEREVNEKLSRLSSIIDLLHDPVAAQHEELEKVLYALLSQLVSLMTRQELSLNSKVVTQIIREALAALPPNSERIRVFVHPADYEMAQSQSREQIDPWHVFSDESLTPGGCRVETLSSLVDSTVETRLQDVLEQIVLKRYASDRVAEQTAEEIKPETAEKSELASAKGTVKTKASESSVTENAAPSENDQQ